VEQAYTRSGSVAYPGLSHALLAWLAENEPNRIQDARWVLSCNGWIFHWLTGEIAAEISDASNPFGDVRKRTYDDVLFRMFGLESLRAMFPAIVEGDSQSACLRAEVAAELGLKLGLRVVMAPYDIVATAYGAGVTSPGQACVILGTTICTEVITADLDLSGPATGTTIALGDDLHLRAMPTLAGCETLEWAARMLGANSLSNLEMLASASPPGAHGVLFLPYLSEAGERSPFLDPQACGSFHGLKLSHTQSDIVRAIYEGLSYAICDCLCATGAAVEEMRVCGGGARSSLWCQMIADVTGVRVLRSSESELGARGAFLFGLAVARKTTVAQTASEFPLTFEVFEPSGDSDSCAQRYDAFLHTRAAVRALWRAKEGW
jgi:xylulokinase